LRGVAIGVLGVVGMTIVAFGGGRAQVVGYIFASLLLVMVGRGLLVGVHVSSLGVKVVGFVSTRRVSWEDVDRFEAKPAGGYPYVGYLVRKQGRPIVIVGISTGGAATEAHRLEAQRPVAQLNQMLREWQEARAAEAATAGGTDDAPIPN